MTHKLFFVLLFLLLAGSTKAQYGFPRQVQALPIELRALVDELSDSESPDHKKLRKLFFAVKRKYLRRHQLSSTYASTLRGETYDCVTGTLLYANLLHMLRYETTIHEFNHHVLLSVETDRGEILFDSTDPYGMIRGKRQVTATIAYYKRQKKVLPDRNIYETIQEEQALGLYYFNQSVKHLDTEEIDVAKAYAAMAFKQYPCDRILALNDLLSRPHAQIISTYHRKAGD